MLKPFPWGIELSSIQWEANDNCLSVGKPSKACLACILHCHMCGMTPALMWSCPMFRKKTLRIVVYESHSAPVSALYVWAKHITDQHVGDVNQSSFCPKVWGMLLFLLLLLVLKFKRTLYCKCVTRDTWLIITSKVQKCKMDSMFSFHVA